LEENYSCGLSVKITVDFRCTGAVRTLEVAPDTYDNDSRIYEWKSSDLMSCTVVPKTILYDGVRVDVFTCMNEDDPDGMELKRYVGDFFTKTFLPMWQGVSIGHISEPTNKLLFDIGCPEIKHYAIGGAL
jgi:hypothetical protein